MRYCKRDGADKNPNEGFWLIPEKQTTVCFAGVLMQKYAVRNKE